jgi:hypothetical protein
MVLEVRAPSATLETLSTRLASVAPTHGAVWACGAECWRWTGRRPHRTKSRSSTNGGKRFALPRAFLLCVPLRALRVAEEGVCGAVVTLSLSPSWALTG